jgi:dihydrofolate reductase
VLMKTLAEQDLIDEYRLAAYLGVLGTGNKLFSEGIPSPKFALAESRPL